MKKFCEKRGKNVNIEGIREKVEFCLKNGIFGDFGGFGRDLEYLGAWWRILDFAF